MINTIVHVADIQFRNYWRQDEFKAVCDRFLYDMQQIKPDRIVIAGDIFHSKTNVSPEASDMVQWFLHECAERSGKVVIILGNHDCNVINPDRLDSITPVVNAMNDDRILFIKNSKMVRDENVNWVVYGILDNYEKPDDLTNKEHGVKYFGLYHGLITGAKDFNSMVYKNGVDPSDKFWGCDAVFAGDIHLRQVFKTNEGAPVIMVGSLIQQSFGENISQHGYCVYDVPSGKFKFVDIESTVKFRRYVINSADDIKKNNEILVNN